jgi:hypothetical protein
MHQRGEYAMSISLRRKNLLAGLAAALLLSSSLTAVSVIASRAAMADEAEDNASVAAFFQQGFAYCDAVALGQAWGVDFYQAKIRGGQMVQKGELRQLSEFLSKGYKKSACGQSSSLELEDSVAVADLWMATPQA